MRRIARALFIGVIAAMTPAVAFAQDVYTGGNPPSVAADVGGRAAAVGGTNSAFAVTGADVTGMVAIALLLLVAGLLLAYVGGRGSQRGRLATS